jgi:hypothetical protein
MEGEISSAWGWAVIIGTVALGVALVYGLVSWSWRTRRDEVVSEQGTERVYREAERDTRREERQT